MHDEFAAHDAVRLGVPAALEPARLPQLLHLLREARDDRVEILFFVGQEFFLGDFQALVRPLQVDQRRR